ncbi:helix-turn-helix domain-containing protein [Streptomyces sp. NPDC001156]
MADDEEVQRVFDALDDVERIADPEARSRAQAQITAATRKRAAKWAAERADLAHQMQDEGESIRGIAKRLGVTPGTVQDLLRGYKGSGQNRPPADERAAGDKPSEE